jgi:hypothetical protein
MAGPDGFNWGAPVVLVSGTGVMSLAGGGTGDLSVAGGLIGATIPNTVGVSFAGGTNSPTVAVVSFAGAINVNSSPTVAVVSLGGTINVASAPTVAVVSSAAVTVAGGALSLAGGVVSVAGISASGGSVTVANTVGVSFAGTSLAGGAVSVAGGVVSVAGLSFGGGVTVSNVVGVSFAGGASAPTISVLSIGGGLAVSVANLVGVSFAGAPTVAVVSIGGTIGVSGGGAASLVGVTTIATGISVVGGIVTVSGLSFGGGVSVSNVVGVSFAGAPSVLSGLTVLGGGISVAGGVVTVAGGVVSVPGLQTASIANLVGVSFSGAPTVAVASIGGVVGISTGGLSVTGAMSIAGGVVSVAGLSFAAFPTVTGVVSVPGLQTASIANTVGVSFAGAPTVAVLSVGGVVGVSFPGTSIAGGVVCVAGGALSISGLSFGGAVTVSNVVGVSTAAAPSVLSGLTVVGGGISLAGGVVSVAGLSFGGAATISNVVGVSFSAAIATAPTVSILSVGGVVGVSLPGISITGGAVCIAGGALSISGLSFGGAVTISNTVGVSLAGVSITGGVSVAGGVVSVAGLSFGGAATISNVVGVSFAGGASSTTVSVLSIGGVIGASITGAVSVAGLSFGGAATISNVVGVSFSAVIATAPTISILSVGGVVGVSLPGTSIAGGAVCVAGGALSISGLSFGGAATIANVVGVSLAAAPSVLSGVSVLGGSVSLAGGVVSIAGLSFGGGITVSNVVGVSFAGGTGGSAASLVGITTIAASLSVAGGFLTIQGAVGLSVSGMSVTGQVMILGGGGGNPNVNGNSIDQGANINSLDTLAFLYTLDEVNNIWRRAPNASIAGGPALLVVGGVTISAPVTMAGMSFGGAVTISNVIGVSFAGGTGGSSTTIAVLSAPGVTAIGAMSLAGGAVSIAGGVVSVAGLSFVALPTVSGAVSIAGGAAVVSLTGINLSAGAIPVLIEGTRTDIGTQSAPQLTTLQPSIGSLGLVVKLAGPGVTVVGGSLNSVAGGVISLAGGGTGDLSVAGGLQGVTIANVVGVSFGGSASAPTIAVLSVAGLSFGGAVTISNVVGVSFAAGGSIGTTIAVLSTSGVFGASVTGAVSVTGGAFSLAGGVVSVAGLSAIGSVTISNVLTITGAISLANFGSQLNTVTGGVVSVAGLSFGGAVTISNVVGVSFAGAATVAILSIGGSGTTVTGGVSIIGIPNSLLYALPPGGTGGPVNLQESTVNPSAGLPGLIVRIADGTTVMGGGISVANTYEFSIAGAVQGVTIANVVGVSLVGGGSTSSPTVSVLSVGGQVTVTGGVSINAPNNGMPLTGFPVDIQDAFLTVAIMTISGNTTVVGAVSIAGQAPVTVPGGVVSIAGGLITVGGAVSVAGTNTVSISGGFSNVSVHSQWVGQPSIGGSAASLGSVGLTAMPVQIGANGLWFDPFNSFEATGVGFVQGFYGGAFTDVSQFSSVVISVFSDQPSGLNNISNGGLTITWTDDPNTTFGSELWSDDLFSYPGNTTNQANGQTTGQFAGYYCIPVKRRFMKISYSVANSANSALLYIRTSYSPLPLPPFPPPPNPGAPLAPAGAYSASTGPVSVSGQGNASLLGGGFIINTFSNPTGSGVNIYIKSVAVQVANPSITAFAAGTGLTLTGPVGIFRLSRLQAQASTVSLYGGVPGVVSMAGGTSLGGNPYGGLNNAPINKLRSIFASPSAQIRINYMSNNGTNLSNSTIAGASPVGSLFDGLYGSLSVIGGVQTVPFNVFNVSSDGLDDLVLMPGEAIAVWLPFPAFMYFSGLAGAAPPLVFDTNYRWREGTGDNFSPNGYI